MFNTTILFLSITSLSNSPFIIPTTNFKISKSTFSYFFNSPIYSVQPLNSFLCLQTKFSNIFGNGILLDFSSGDYEQEVFQETLDIKPYTSQLKIISCLFTDCISQSEGGGLKAEAQNANIFIQSTGFTKCRSSKTGGAFYLACKKFTLQRCGITLCAAGESAAFYFTNKYENTDEFQHTYVHDISPTSTATNTIFFDSHEPNIQNINFSLIQQPSIQSVIEFQQFEGFTYRYSLFNMCQGTNLLYFNEICDDTTIQFSNFDSTKASDAIFHLSKTKVLKITSCSFMRDDSSKYTNQYSWYDGCYFDHPKDSDKFPYKDYHVKCQFDSPYTTFNIFLDDEQAIGCWDLVSLTITSDRTDPIPYTEEPKESSSANSKISVSVSTIACCILIIVAAIAAFYGYKWWRTRKSQQSALLMYSQV